MGWIVIGTGVLTFLSMIELIGCSANGCYNATDPVEIKACANICNEGLKTASIVISVLGGLGLIGGCIARNCSK